MTILKVETSLVNYPSLTHIQIFTPPTSVLSLGSILISIYVYVMYPGSGLPSLSLTVTVLGSSSASALVRIGIITVANNSIV
jgi:hypothetical protein